MRARRTLSLLGIAACLALSAPACKSGDGAVPIGSVRKLGGAPARVLKLAFSGDGLHVLALERRSSEPGEWWPDDRFAITKRPVAGGDAVDLVVSEREIVDFVPLGDGALYLDRRRLPPLIPERPREAKERTAMRARLAAQRDLAVRETSLSEVRPGKSPAAIAGKDARCYQLVGAAGGQWAAYSVGGAKDPNDPAEAEVHVLGNEKSEDIVLSRAGVVLDISPDGARVLVQRQFRKPPVGTRGEPPSIPAKPLFDATAVSLVDVKANTTLTIPMSITVDGAEIKTDKMAVRLTAEGLSFRSERGEVYRSALDGSKAERVAEALPEAPVAGPAPSTSGTAVAASAPLSAGVLRLFDARSGAVDLRADGDGVELSRPGADSAHPKKVSAKVELPFAAMGPVAIDPAGARLAFAAISDTSRDGVTTALDDDATVFVSDPAKGTLAPERAQTGLLVDELRPKVAAAVGVPAEKVTIAHAGRKLEVTAELPEKEGEKAKDLVDRWMVAAKAMTPVVTMKQAVLKLRVGSLEARVLTEEEGGVRPYLSLYTMGIRFRDPEALPLVHRDPSLTTITGGMYPRTLAGIFENTGSTPLGPIEITVTAKPFYDRPDPDPKQVKASVGPIDPGKKMAYRVTIWEEVHGPDFDVAYTIAGKRITPFNLLNREDGLDFLELARLVHDKHGMTLENDFAPESELAIYRVTIAEKHAALSDEERLGVLNPVLELLAKHFRRFHENDLFRVRFLSPKGGGWEVRGKTAARFEKEEDADRE